MRNQATYTEVLLKNMFLSYVPDDSEYRNDGKSGRPPQPSRPQPRA